MALKSIRPKAREAIVDAAIQLLARNPGASMNEIAMVMKSRPSYSIGITTREMSLSLPSLSNRS